jgi:hypothetical protein
MPAGMDVIYYDSAYINHSEVARRCETLEELLRAADVVSIHTTHDEASHHLMNATTFGQSEFRSPSSLLSARSSFESILSGRVGDSSFLLDATQ